MDSGYSAEHWLVPGGYIIITRVYIKPLILKLVKWECEGQTAVTVKTVLWRSSLEQSKLQHLKCKTKSKTFQILLNFWSDTGY